MGRSMALRLLETGHTISVHNRTRSKAADLEQRGALWQDSPALVAKESELVFLMVGFPRDVRETILGPDGILSTIRSGSVIVDMTTSSPSLAAEIAETARKQGVVALDAPVSGGDIGARNGTLSIMIGGEESAARNLAPIWDLIGRTVVYHGSAGSGQHAKMVNQTLIAGNMIGVCEALLYAYRSGLDLEKVLESVGGGAAGSWSLSQLAPRVLKGDFEPGFMIEHFIKDLGIALEESRRMQLALPGLALAEQLYIAASAQGFARKGTQALTLALARLSRTDWPEG